LKEDISLNDDDPRGLNDPNLNKYNYKLLPLDNYDIHENERDLYQPHYNYVNQDKEIFILKTLLMKMILYKKIHHLLYLNIMNLKLK
jgi:hypothetical protein